MVVDTTLQNRDRQERGGIYLKIKKNTIFNEHPVPEKAVVGVEERKLLLQRVSKAVETTL